MSIKDPKRFLSDAEKLQVLVAYGYRCQGQNCETPDLSEESGYHFHHIKPHCDGGATVPMNHVPLCVPCHKLAHLKQVQRDFGAPWGLLREWQQDAISQYIRDYDSQHTWVLEASPGAGKSLFAASVSNYALNNSDITHVVCIAPWTPIIRSLKRSFGVYDLDVRERFHYDTSKGVLQRTPFTEVTVDTYQSFCRPLTIELIKKWKEVYGWRFLLILDEVHHTSTKSGKWGAYLDPISKLADRLLVMSGTYFRTDCAPISFLKYEDGKPRVDKAFTYKECVAKKYVRQVSFRYHNPVLDIHSHKTQRTKKYRLSNVPIGSRKMLAVARNEVLDPKGTHVDSMILDAWRELQVMREKWSDAACLVVCRSSSRDEDEQRMVDAVSQKIRAITNANVVTVTSDDKASRGAIDAFVDSRDPFLCAIRMVSEGVDIPRIRMVLFLSFTESEMLFRQIVGRCIRYIEGKEDDTAALVIMPKFPIMADFAERFEEEAAQGMLERVPAPPINAPPSSAPDGPCQKCNSTPCKCFVVVDSEVMADGGQIADSFVSEDFIQLAMCVRDMSRAQQHANPVQLGDALRCAAEAKGSMPSVSFEDKREKAWKGVERQVKSIAKHAYQNDFGAAWVVEVDQKFHATAAEIKATWRIDQIHHLRDKLRSRLEEVLNV